MEKTYTIELTNEELKFVRLALSTAAIKWEDRGNDEKAEAFWNLRDRLPKPLRQEDMA